MLEHDGNKLLHAVGGLLSAEVKGDVFAEALAKNHHGFHMGIIHGLDRKYAGRCMNTGEPELSRILLNTISWLKYKQDFF